MTAHTSDAAHPRWSVAWTCLLFSLAACIGPFTSDGQHGKGQLDSGATSPPGLVCGVFDRERVARMTKIPSMAQHEESFFKTYPVMGERFHLIECTVLDEADPPNELMGITVQQDYSKDDAFVQSQIVDVRPGSLKFSPVWGKGAVAPNLGGYVVRQCDGGGEYLLVANNQNGIGTAKEWLHLIESAIVRADAIGACVFDPPSENVELGTSIKTIPPTVKN
jgi:hypothetical protein